MRRLLNLAWKYWSRATIHMSFDIGEAQPDGVGVLFTQHNGFGMRLELLDRISLVTAGL